MPVLSLLSRNDGAIIDLGECQTTINHTTLETLLYVYKTARKGYAMQNIQPYNARDIQPPVYTFPIYSTRNLWALGSKVYYYDYPHPANTQAKAKYPHRMHIAIYPDRIRFRVTGRKPSWWNKAKDTVLCSHEILLSTFDQFVEECLKHQHSHGAVNPLAGTCFA